MLVILGSARISVDKDDLLVITILLLVVVKIRRIISSIIFIFIIEIIIILEGSGLIGQAKEEESGESKFHFLQVFIIIMNSVNFGS